MKNKLLTTSILALLFIIGWSFFMAILTDSMPFGRGPEGEWATITHEKYDFSIDFPTKWKIDTYGDEGHRGLDEVKLRIWENNLNSFKIEIWLTPYEAPTLEDVVEWDERWLERGIENVTSRGGKDYKEIAFENSTIQDQKVLRRTYTLGDYFYEVVYIARTNDMAKIKLQSPKGTYESYLEDFNRIVSSFSPIP
jgi:hypothetical protein